MSMAPSIQVSYNNNSHTNNTTHNGPFSTSSIHTEYGYILHCIYYARLYILIVICILILLCVILPYDTILSLYTFPPEFNDPSNLTPRKAQLTDKLVSIKIVEVDGIHRILPHVIHNTEETKGSDKIVLLLDLLKRYNSKKYRTMIFCNTIASAR